MLFGRDVPSAGAAVASYSDGRQFPSNIKKCTIAYICWNACRFGLLCSIRCTILEQLKLPAATLTPVPRRRFSTGVIFGVEGTNSISLCDCSRNLSPQILQQRRGFRWKAAPHGSVVALGF
jgi:hypothetical protein